MFKWMQSVSVVIGSLTAGVASAAASGVLPPEYAVPIMGVLGAIIAMARFRPGAGASITADQTATPN